MTEVAIILLIYLAGLVSGYLRWGRKPGKPWERKRTKFDVLSTDFLTVGQGHQVKFLSIEGPKALAVCARIVAGRSLSFRAMAGIHKKIKGKPNGQRLLSRGQWEHLRNEMTDQRHGWGYIDKRHGNTLRPTPTGRKEAKKALDAARAAQAHSTKEAK